jgi:hypothetical protein
MASQGLLFAEPSVAETGVWCTLSEGIDPADWAALCRYIGSLSPEKFQSVRDEIQPHTHTGCENEEYPRTSDFTSIPLVSIGPSGLGGRYQREMIV